VELQARWGRLMCERPEHAENVAVTCNLCGEVFDGTTIWGHLAGAHAIDAGAEMLRWPDGEPVVIDTTLEPGHFRERGDD
jgi:hypothetical protein